MDYRGLVLVNTVGEKLEGLSRRDLDGASDARRDLEMFGYPSQKNFEHMVCTINNCPVAIEDVCNANTISRCDFPTLKVVRFF